MTHAHAPDTVTGELCWADVQTPDVAAAKAFYAAVFGWRYEDLPTPDGRSYAQAFLGDDLVARRRAAEPAAGSAGHRRRSGTSTSRPTTPGPWPRKPRTPAAPCSSAPRRWGTPASWCSWTRPAAAPPACGRPERTPAAGRYNEPGALAWAELLTPEPQAAVGFFQQLFGHEVTEYPQDDGGTYTTLMVDGAEVAGIARSRRCEGTLRAGVAGLLRRLRRRGSRADGRGRRRRGADRTGGTTTRAGPSPPSRIRRAACSACWRFRPSA